MDNYLDEMKLRRIEMRNEANPPLSLKGLTEKELDKAKAAWKKIDSACLVDILERMKTGLLETFYWQSFEKGVEVPDMLELQFKPVRFLSEYYLLTESRIGIIQHWQGVCQQ